MPDLLCKYTSRAIVMSQEIDNVEYVLIETKHTSSVTALDKCSFYSLPTKLAELLTQLYVLAHWSFQNETSENETIQIQ